MKAMLIDITKCSGCEQCIAACKKSNSLEPELPIARHSKDGLSSRKLTSIVQVEENRFAKKMCLHCLQPACVDACLVGAMQKTQEGAVIYDASKCIGCRYCMLACPVGIPRYEWDKKLPYVKKCEMCFSRQQDGKTPACVAACPTGACTFGERDQLIAQAKETIAQNPGKYINHIYGEKELGGTCVLYITDTPLKTLGWPENVGDRAINSYTWPILSKTPMLAGSVFAFLSSTCFIINRRMKIQAEKQKQQSARDSASGETK